MKKKTKRKSAPKRKAAPAPAPKRKAAPAPKAEPARKRKAAPAPAPAPARKRKTRTTAAKTLAPLLVALQGETQAQVAKRLGVGVRTLRRYKNENVAPPEKVLKKINKRAAAVAKRNVAENRKRGARLPKTKYSFQAERQTRIDPTDIKRKRRIKSDTIMISVAGVPVEYIAELIKKYSERGGAFRVLYLLPAGKKDYNGQSYDEDRNVSTQWESLEQDEFADDAGVLDFLSEITQRGPLQYIVVTDPKR